MYCLEKVKGQNILLIDGDESIRDALKMFFRVEGLRIDAVETAEEGLTALGKQAYDIIIAERQLPGMDGDRFFEHIHERCPDAFKILMTACASPTPPEGRYVDAYLEKPISAKHIKECLTHCMERRK